ncbi:MAG: aminopeptidase N [Hyphomicrobium sp.]|nr:MAG: aminopeptidase N [Hyphomicrobium sp.]
MKPEKPRPIRLADYEPPAYLIDKVDLEFSLHPTSTRVRARTKMRPNPAFNGERRGLRLDGEQFQFGHISIDGAELAAASFVRDDVSLTIHDPPRKAFTVDITSTVNPDQNKALQGLYRSRGVYCTQCEAQGFRRLTYFLDRPDVLSVYSVRIEADVVEAPILLANGNPVERGTLDRGRRHYAVWRDPHPKPCYLFALVAGDLSPVASSFKTMSGRNVDLKIYVEHGKETRATWAMGALKRAMQWDEERFGREYDLDVFNIVAVSDFNMGAMENKGLNIFNDRLILASAETATDSMFEAIESVVAHEYFHNWTGNRITCRDWFQLCLKEGLTVYRDQEFSGDQRSRAVQRIVDVRQLRTYQFAEDAGPLAHAVRPDTYIEINNFYTSTIYEKGAELVRMIETILGAELFRAGLDLYFERHDGTAATIEEFLACFEAASGRDLEQFKLWYSQAGTPGLVCALSYDRGSECAEIRIDQVLPPAPGQLKTQPLHIPVRLGLLCGDGHDIQLAETEHLKDGVLNVTRRSQTFKFKNVSSRPVLSLLRGFSAPVNLTVDLGDRDLEFLMANDSDPFNRWQSANTFATRTMVHIATALAQGKRSSRGLAFARALGAIISDEQLDPAYRAEVLKLPTQADVAREIGRNVDPGLVWKAHLQVSRLVGRTLGAGLEKIYHSMADRVPFSPDAAAAGRRALRNAALTLLAVRGEPSDHALISDHYFKSDNMTEQAHALTLLAQHDDDNRRKALDHFHARWANDNLVIDTWFAVQALSPLPRALSDVKALVTHPTFALTAPNKVRALLGTFALQNPLQFNRDDGAGYAFMVDKVLELDTFNPQIAARMLGCFKSWRSLEAKRRALVRKALQKVAKTPELSRDVFEIVTKMLEA